MRKTGLVFLLLCAVLLSGCGGKDDGEPWQGVTEGMDLSKVTGQEEYYDIVSETTKVCESASEYVPDENVIPKFLGMQFYQGEPVQLWEEIHTEDMSYRYSDIYLHGADGSRRLLLQNMSIYSDDPMSHDYPFSPLNYDYSWYLSQEGDFYYWRRSYVKREEKRESLLVKLNASGEELYRTGWEYGVDVDDIFQMPDGATYLILDAWYNGGDFYAYKGGDLYSGGSKTFHQIDPATGAVALVKEVELINKLGFNQYFGAGENGLISLNNGSTVELVSIDLQNGDSSVLLSFTGTSYRLGANVGESMTLQAVRTTEDGSLELLWADPDAMEGISEKLRMEKVERIPITLCTIIGVDEWTLERVAAFNRTNGTYHVMIQCCGPENDSEDFTRLISIQVATGGGPDILCGNVLSDYVVSMIEKGAFEDMTPYMEKSGIREEDYFPITFGTWRDGDRMYGVNPVIHADGGSRIDESVLGGRGEPDIESLMDALLTWQGEASYLAEVDSGGLLREFFQGTEDLWGMIDWERGRCDFSGDLFAKILKVAARYGEEGKDTMDGTVPRIAKRRYFSDIYFYDCLAEQEEAGEVTCGILFDDGCHAAISSSSTMAINANSRCKEGAWEFIRYLLSEEAQSLTGGIPANRKAFDAWMEKELKRVADGKEVVIVKASVVDGEVVLDPKSYTQAEMTEERISEYVEAIEDLRTLPIRTAPVIDIICEEAEYYFNGVKSIEEISRIIQNRVRLYLRENS